MKLTHGSEIEICEAGEYTMINRSPVLGQPKHASCKLGVQTIAIDELSSAVPKAEWTDGFW